MPDFHRLDPDADAVFLRRTVADPLSRVAFLPTNAVALCATCGLVSLRETWDACGGCPNGHASAAPWSAAEAARAISARADTSGDGARTAPPPRAATPAAAALAPPVDEPSRRTGLWIALGVGALLIAALGAAYVMNRDAPPADAPPAVAAGPSAPQAVVAEAGETEGTLGGGDFRTPDGHFQDLYTFAADSSGRTLAFTVESDAFYPDIVVTGPDGQPVEGETVTAGDASSSLRGVAVRNLRGPGVYNVLVSARRPGSEGAYTLRIRADEVVIALPTTGRQVTGELTARSPQVDGRYRDTYSFAGAVGREHTITVRSGVFTPTIVLTGPAGAVRGESAPTTGGAVFRFTPDRAGTYRAVVSTREARRTGAYTVLLALGPAPPTPPPAAAAADAPSAGGLRAGAAPVRDTLAAGDTRTYTASGRIGDRVSVEVRASGFTPTLTVVGPDGQRTPAVADGDRVRVSVTLPSDGRFRVIVGSTGGAGGYTVSLEQRAAVTSAPIPRLPGADAPRPADPGVEPPGPAEGEYRPQPLGNN